MAGVGQEDMDIQQLNIQKYLLRDGNIMWQGEFHRTAPLDTEEGQTAADEWAER
ncbi:hypothetical protein GJV04_00065 [Enterobacteriaceae bacterium RIT714]|nr:hypothetical protein [Enterobacteriaceae bacterium RIT714]